MLMPMLMLKISLQDYINLTAALNVAIKHYHAMSAAHEEGDHEIIQLLSEQAELWQSINNELYRQRHTRPKVRQIFFTTITEVP